VTLVMDRVVHWNYSQEWDALVVFTDNDSKELFLIHDV
jgi:hypothetical protein